MRRAAILLILASGCSTNPVADLADWLKPARADMARGPGRGGVCQPTPATGVEPIGPGATPTVSGPPPVAGPGAGPAPDERLPPIDAPSPVR